MPDRYASEILKIGQGGEDQEAMQDIQMINMGQQPQPRKDASPEYIAYYNQYVNSPAFKQLPPEIQRVHMEQVKGLISSVKGGMKETTETPGQPGLIGKFAGLFGR